VGCACTSPATRPTDQSKKQRTDPPQTRGPSLDRGGSKTHSEGFAKNTFTCRTPTTSFSALKLASFNYLPRADSTAIFRISARILYVKLPPLWLPIDLHPPLPAKRDCPPTNLRVPLRHSPLPRRQSYLILAIYRPTFSTCRRPSQMHQFRRARRGYGKIFRKSRMIPRAPPTNCRRVLNRLPAIF